MSEIIDLIAPPLDTCQVFTVNNAAPGGYVNCGLPAGPWYGRNAANGDTISKGDSFQLIAAGLIIPEGFTLWKDPVLLNEPLISLLIQPFGIVSASAYYYPNIALNKTFISMENFEEILDVFFDCSKAVPFFGSDTLLTEDFKITVTINGLVKISMQGVPASMNGKLFQIIPFLKILHTFPMT